MPENGKYKHVEAFCIMTYHCQQCGRVEKVWNSRDGVTPFIIGCDMCGGGEMRHVDWQNDRRAEDHIPERGQLVFIDVPESLKKPLFARRISRFDGTQYEVAAGEREALIQRHIKDIKPGEPFLIRMR